MKKGFVLPVFLTVLGLSQTFAQSIVLIGNTAVEIDTVYTGLDIPWEITYGPDDHLWITERKGLVSRIDPVAGTKTPVLDITGQVYQQSESGLLGMALHPDFPTLPYVFVVYTFGSSGNIFERLVQYSYNGTTLGSPQVLIDSIPGNTTHDGSRLAFLPDKTLLMSTGDAQNTSLPQNMSSLNGKVLRLAAGGTPPGDNPFPGSYVYTLGHRNMQGLVVANGRVYASEHGASSDDEIQILEAGRNYGWPDVQGYCDQPSETSFCNDHNVAEPIRAWTPTIAPAGMDYYSNPMFPEFHNSLLLAVLKDKKLAVLHLNPAGDQILSEDLYFVNQFGRLRDVCVGPQKEIYIATNGPLSSNTEPNTHSIIVLRPPFVNSLEETTAKAPLRLYPNPFTGRIYLDDPGNLAPDRLQVMDMQGRVCADVKVLQASAGIDLQQLAPGVYIMHLYRGGQELSVQKIVRR